MHFRGVVGHLQKEKYHQWTQNKTRKPRSQLDANFTLTYQLQILTHFDLTWTWYRLDRDLTLTGITFWSLTIAFYE